VVKSAGEPELPACPTDATTEGGGRGGRSQSKGYAVLNLINTAQLSKEEKEGRKERLREGSKLHPKTLKYSVKVVRSGDHLEVYEYDTRARATCVSPQK
jgi:hypothetical protein